MALQFWFKGILSNKFVVDGKVVDFEALSGNRGVIAVDDAIEANKSLVDGLNKAAAEQRGIAKISQEDYESLKKNFPLPPTSTPGFLQEGLRTAPRAGGAWRPPLAKPAAAPVANHAQAAPPAAAAPVAVPDAPAVEQRPPDQPDFKGGHLPPTTRKLGNIPAASDI